MAPATNADIYQCASQVPVFEMVQCRRLQLFGHVARCDAEQDHTRALKAIIGVPKKLEETRGLSSPHMAESGLIRPVPS